MSGGIGRWALIAVVLVMAGCGTETVPEPGVRAWTVPADDEVASLLSERMAHNGVGMVVGLIDGDRRRVVVHGRSGADGGRPLDGATVFQIGSLTKVITSLLLAEMVAQGDVRLDDPVMQFLPAEAAMVPVGRAITLRDLATHTSGLPSMPDNFDIRGTPDPYAAQTPDDLWAFLAQFTPPRAPGASYEYSNLGVSLLGRALARKAGTTYEALVTERILTPLGMRSTSITLDSDQQSRLAPGHDPYLRPVGSWEMVTLQASGSLRSTADDMMKLLDAYLGRAASSRVREAVAIQLKEGVTLNGAFHPLGLSARPDGTYRHAGGKEGYRSGLVFSPALGRGVVVLANTRTYDAEPMALALHLATGEPLPPASAAPDDKPRVRLSSAALERFAGRYQAEDKRRWEVVVAGSLLRIRYPNNSIFEFVSSGPTEFFYNAGNDDITFDVDASGLVTGMTVYGDGKPAGNGQYAARLER